MIKKYKRNIVSLVDYYLKTDTKDGSTGNHLHFEVIQNGVRVNALDFFE